MYVLLLSGTLDLRFAAIELATFKEAANALLETAYS